jgi:hypothetical protein
MKPDVKDDRQSEAARLVWDESVQLRDESDAGVDVSAACGKGACRCDDPRGLSLRPHDCCGENHRGARAATASVTRRFTPAPTGSTPRKSDPSHSPPRRTAFAYSDGAGLARERIPLKLPCTRHIARQHGAHAAGEPAFGGSGVKPIRTTSRRCRALAIACASPLVALGAPALAEDADESRGTIKIEVTGSNILRSEAESALPVQVITREEIERSGSTTVAELMSKVSANVLGQNDQLSISSFRPPGLSSINLRGIGSGDTLVLLNGRRVANYAFDGSAVDVNSIPLAAVERVEILKDGASAIYGSDAVAGVVNFILRKDFRGIEVTGYGSRLGQGGGEQYQGVVSAGFGDLAKDRYNVFVTAVHQKDAPLTATERAFSRTAYRPDEGLFQLHGRADGGSAAADARSADRAALPLQHAGARQAAL